MGEPNKRSQPEPILVREKHKKPEKQLKNVFVLVHVRKTISLMENPSLGTSSNPLTEAENYPGGTGSFS